MAVRLPRDLRAFAAIPPRLAQNPPERTCRYCVGAVACGPAVTMMT